MSPHNYAAALTASIVFAFAFALWLLISVFQLPWLLVLVVTVPFGFFQALAGIQGYKIWLHRQQQTDQHLRPLPSAWSVVLLAAILALPTFIAVYLRSTGSQAGGLVAALSAAIMAVLAVRFFDKFDIIRGSTSSPEPAPRLLSYRAFMWVWALLIPALVAVAAFLQDHPVGAIVVLTVYVVWLPIGARKLRRALEDTRTE